MSADDGTNLPENTDEPIGEDHVESMPTDDHATHAILQNVRTALFESNELEDSITAPSMGHEQPSTKEQVGSPTVEDGATALDLLGSSDKGKGETLLNASQNDMAPKEIIATKVAKAPEAVTPPAGETVAPVELTTVDESVTSEKDIRKQECESSKLEPATDLEFDIAHMYMPSEQRRAYLSARKSLLLPCGNKHSIFSHGIHSQEHYIPRGAFKRNEQIQRIKDKLLPIHSRPHKQITQKRRAHLELMYAKMLPHRKSQRDLIEPTTPQPTSPTESVVLEKLWDPPFSMTEYIPDTVSAVKTQVSEPLNGSEINFSRSTFSYASKNANIAKSSAEASKTGDKILDEILDLSFDEILQRDFPEGIKIRDIGPKVEIEDATKDYDWFDEKSDDEEDTEGL